MTAAEKSPAAKAMDEAIELAVEGRSPYPSDALFVDADSPSAGQQIRQAADEGVAVVLVAADGSSRTLAPVGAARD